MKSQIENRQAFTLVELLVVVAIIVVLLALLIPAMDKAIYQAELAKCAAQIRGMAAALTTYAVGNNRAFPRRDVPLTVASSQAHIMVESAGTPGKDDLLYLDGVFPRAMHSDPVSKSVNYVNMAAGTRMYSAYHFRYGWRFTGAGGGRGMMRLGDRVEWRQQKYSLLVSDYDELWDKTKKNNLNISGHPDPAGMMGLQWLENKDGFYMSRWGFTTARGPLDLNFGYADLSVIRLGKVKNYNIEEDDRMVALPNFSNGDDAGWVTFVPKE